jgi:hypothetical protein
MGTKNLTHWYNQKLSKDTGNTGKKNSQAGMIKDPMESGVNIVAVLEDFFVEMCDPSAQELSEMTHKSMLIEYWRAFISIVCTRFWN